MRYCKSDKVIVSNIIFWQMSELFWQLELSNLKKIAVICIFTDM